MELNTIATTEKDHDLLVLVFLKESEEKKETFVTMTQDITLFKIANSGLLVIIIYSDVNGLFERQSSQVIYFLSLSRTE